MIKKLAARNRGFQSRVAGGYCGMVAGEALSLKVDNAVREELDHQYTGSKVQPKLWHLGSYWLEGYEQADYGCELADRQVISSGRGLLMFRKAAGLPQPKPWLDASDVVDCDAKLLRVQVVLTP